jgi:hypothetical protein
MPQLLWQPPHIVGTTVSPEGAVLVTLFATAETVPPKILSPIVAKATVAAVRFRNALLVNILD